MSAVGNPVTLQSLEFFYSALLGAGLGAIFDIFRVIRFYANKKKTVTLISDVFFWSIAVIALLAFVLTVSGGKMRWYVLFGIFCGGFVYVSALSEIVFRIGVSLVFVFKKLLKLVTHPFYLLFRSMWRKLLVVGRRIFRSREGKKGELYAKRREHEEEKA